MVGFTNLGETNNHVLHFEASLSSPCTLAKSVLVFMVRGLFLKLNFPHAQFVCSTMNGDLLHDPVWDAISRLECQGIMVLAFTYDGASINRRLWKLHSADGNMIHKVHNNFVPEAVCPLFLISDPPHQLKTIHNCWWSKKMKLWVIYIHNY